MSDKVKKCPKCITEIPFNATICPQCRSKIPTPVNKKVVIVCLVILFACYYNFKINGGSYTTSNIPGGRSDMVAVCTYSQIEVDSMLKSPSSANHPSCSQGTYTNTGNRHKFKSYVDAKNSFGVELRQYYSCNVEYLENNEYSVKCLFE